MANNAELSVVTASDIGDYVYDPQRWLMQQTGERVLTQAEENALARGSTFHDRAKAYVRQMGDWPKQGRYKTRIHINSVIYALVLTLLIIWFFWGRH